MRTPTMIRAFHPMLPIVAFLALGSSCANTKGDDVQCPTCDNTTQLLSGVKCVPLAEIPVCGPDGHAHGGECHCSSGQAPTVIGGASYCLQLSCGGAVSDPAAAACDEAGRTAEEVGAATSLSGVDAAHVPVGKVVLVSVPAGQESYVHFEADEAGEMHVFASTAGIVQGAMTEAGAVVLSTNEGANEDCAASLPETWGIAVKAAGPVVVRLKSPVAAQLKLVVMEGSHGH